jgi:acyl-CoA dehydrogenase
MSPTPAWMNEELELLAATCRRFFLKECVPHYDRWEQQGCVDREIWQKAGTAGLLCASMPERYGGAGGTFAHEAVIAIEANRAGVSGLGIPLHNAIVAPYILNYGSEEQKRRWLPGMASSELIGAIAMSEPAAGSDLQGIRTTA